MVEHAKKPSRKLQEPQWKTQISVVDFVNVKQLSSLVEPVR